MSCVVVAGRWWGVVDRCGACRVARRLRSCVCCDVGLEAQLDHPLPFDFPSLSFLPLPFTEWNGPSPSSVYYYNNTE